MRLSGALAAIHELGAARWPDISMTTEDLARYAARVSLAEGAEAHAADVFLVCACLQGNARAVRELDRLIDLHTRSFVARIDTSPVFVDEVRQRIRERLLLGDEPRLARYSGAGPLIAWLRVLGVRLAVDMKRAPSGSRPTLSAEIGARLMYPSVDPELRLIETESRHDVIEVADSAPAVALVNRILRLAIELGASDLHFVPRKNDLNVRARVDGVMRDVSIVPRSQQSAVVARLKVMGQLDIAERRLPQDGRVSISIAGVDMDLRVAILSGVNGEEAVLRISYIASRASSPSRISGSRRTRCRRCAARFAIPPARSSSRDRPEAGRRPRCTRRSAS